MALKFGDRVGRADKEVCCRELRMEIAEIYDDMRNH
jgi:hypothetical protein